MIWTRRSSPTRDNEARGFLQCHCFGAERCQRRLGIVDKGLEPSTRSVDAKQRNQRSLAATLVLCRGLAHRRRISFRIEQIVGELERLTKGRRVGGKRASRYGIGAAEHGASVAGEGEQRAGLHLLHLCHLHRAETLSFRGEVECLTAGHAIYSSGLREQTDEFGANGTIRMRTRPAQNVEGEREQRIPRKN